MTRSFQAIGAAVSCFSATAAWSGTDLRIDFEKAPPGINWKVETTQLATKAADWAVVQDAAAPSPTQELSIRRINDRSRNVFNLHWTPDIPFENGTLEVRVRANSGSIDQGGGLVWCVLDARNYYLARYNPLESNLRVYVVVDGSRRQLASAENIAIPAGRWWQLRIAHTGSWITAWLVGVKRLQLSDETLRGSSGVGLWTKADTASSFDDLVVRRFRSVPTENQ